MPARTPAQAVAALLDEFRRVTSTVTADVLIASGYQPSDRAEAISFRRNVAGVPLRGTRPLLLTALHWYHIETEADRRQWATPTAGYRYEITDIEQRLIVGFHWHPASRSPIAFPHVHVGVRAASLDLSKAHIPTGVITLRQVVRFVIEELGIEPLRADWRAILGAD